MVLRSHNGSTQVLLLIKRERERERERIDKIVGGEYERVCVFRDDHV